MAKFVDESGFHGLFSSWPKIRPTILSCHSSVPRLYLTSRHLSRQPRHAGRGRAPSRPKIRLVSTWRTPPIAMMSLLRVRSQNPPYTPVVIFFKYAPPDPDQPSWPTWRAARGRAERRADTRAKIAKSLCARSPGLERRQGRVRRGGDGGPACTNRRRTV